MTGSVPIVGPTNKRTLELKALEILMSCQPEMLKRPGAVDVECLFELQLPQIIPNLETGFRRLRPGVEGLTNVAHGGRATSFVSMDHAEAAVGNRTAERRLRFTTAHETSHAFLHVPQFRKMAKTYESQQGGRIVTVKRSDLPAFKDPEWQANYLAGAILMPKSSISALMKDGATFEEMLDVFEVNRSALETRLNKIEVSIGT